MYLNESLLQVSRCQFTSNLISITWIIYQIAMNNKCGIVERFDKIFTCIDRSLNVFRLI